MVEKSSMNLKKLVEKGPLFSISDKNDGSSGTESTPKNFISLYTLIGQSIRVVPAHILIENSADIAFLSIVSKISIKR